MKKGLRRVAAVAVATLVVAPALATVASATSTFAFDRLQGANRYDTSAVIGTTFGASTNVILANGTDAHTVDALTANYLAGFLKAPIMLTQLGTTPANVLARITASGATDVWLVGGEGVISAAQSTALDAKFGTVHRLGGADRYLTAEKVIGQVGKAPSTTALLATGIDFPDALGAGPLSYVKGMPVAITQPTSLPAATLRALKAAEIKKVIVLGGETIVAPAVLTALAAEGITLDQRIFGGDRAETSTKLADYMITSQGFSNTAVNVASGASNLYGADALGGSALSGKENRPTLITGSGTVAGRGLLEFLTAHSATLASGHIFGGTGAVSAALATAMTNAARAVASNQTYTVTPGQATSTTKTVSTTAVGETNQGLMSYTVTGLDNTKTYTIALYDCDSVSTTANTTTFTDNTTLTNNDGTSIEVVNGAPQTPAATTATNTFQVAGVSPVSGAITFSVDSVVAGTCVVPVVYNDANSSGTLNFATAPTASAPQAPSEAFGVGGQTTYIGPPAASGNLSSTVVSGVTANTFQAGGFTYTYNVAGSVYNYYDNVSGTYLLITQAQFDSYLSDGDSVSAFSYNASGASTFYIDNDVANAPTAVTATVGNFDAGTTSNDVKVSWAASTGGWINNYNVYEVATAAATTGTLVGQTTNATTLTVNVLNVTTGTHLYKVEAISNTGDSSAFSASASATTIAPATPATHDGAPVSTLAVFQDNNSNGTIDSADVLRITFDETMSAPAATASLTLTDTNTTATVGTVTNGVNSTWTLVSGTTYVITLTSAPVTSIAGSTAGIQYPATVTAATGVQDTAASNTPAVALDWALAGDKIF